MTTARETQTDTFQPPPPPKRKATLTPLVKLEDRVLDVQAAKEKLRPLAKPASTNNKTQDSRQHCSM